MEAQQSGIGTRRERDRELSAGTDVDREALLHHPAHDLGREERLPRVVDAGACSVAPGGALERVESRGRMGADLVLVEHIERSAETGREITDGDTRDHELAVARALGRGGPHGLRQIVRVGRDGEPRGHVGAGGRGGHGQVPIVGSSRGPDRDARGAATGRWTLAV